MFFVIGTALAAISVFTLGLCYLAARRSQSTFWTSDFMVGSIYIPLILMLMSFSAGAFYHVLRDFSTRPVTGMDLTRALAILIVSAAAWRLTGLGRRIKAHRKAEKATIIQVDFQKEHSTTPPASGGKAA